MSGMSNGTLADLQHRLQTYLLSAATDLHSVLPLLRAPASRRPDAVPAAHPAPGADPARGRGLAIYHAGYRSRLREVMGTVFERTWAYLGDTEFDALCSTYIETWPSTHRNLRAYGSMFPALLREALPADPEVAELATMDWLLHLAFDAPDTAILSHAQLSAFGQADWEYARLRFHPGVALAVFEWNVVDVWHALDQGEQPPPVQRLPAALGHLFWRSAQRARFRSLSPAEHAALQALADGAEFAAVCEHIATVEADAATRIGAWLGRWLADELICALECEPAS